MDVDPVAVQDHEGLVAELRALKTACGKSTTRIASDAGLSTSGIEGMLAGANFPLEETVRRFVEACGVASARPWLQARARAAGTRPKVSRVAPEVREELEALRTRNTKLAEQVAALEQQAAVLPAVSQTTEQIEQNGAVVDWTAKAERLTAEFFDALLLLYIHAGEPSLETANLPISSSSLGAMLNGRRSTVPSYAVMTAVVEALLHDAPAAERGQELQRWHQRWTEARYAQRRAQAEEVEWDHLAEDRLAQAEQVLAEARAQADKLVRQARDRARIVSSVEVQQAIRAAEEAAREQINAAQRPGGNGQQAKTVINGEIRALREHVDRFVVPPQRAAEFEEYFSELESLRDQVASSCYRAMERVFKETQNLPRKLGSVG